jgi:hypothetical protein
MDGGHDTDATWAEACLHAVSLSVGGILPLDNLDEISRVEPGETRLASDCVSPRALSSGLGPFLIRTYWEQDVLGTECVLGLEPTRLSCVTAWLRSVCVPILRTGTHTMLKQPIHGFAKRVNDTVARAMAILQSRQDHASKSEDRPLSGSNSSRRTS